MTNPHDALTANEQSHAAEREAAVPGGVREFARAVLHGDDEHRDWLTEAAECWMAGRPLPAPRGKGTTPAAETAPGAGLMDAARVLVLRHDQDAEAAGFQACGCIDCVPLRAALSRAGERA